MTELNKNASIVGFFFLLLAIVGPVRLIYVPTKLFVHGDAEAPAANILAHETLFRLGLCGRAAHLRGEEELEHGDLTITARHES